MPAADGKSKTVPCACCAGLVFKPALECEGFSFVRCCSCNLVQRNPQPLKEEIITRYKSIYGNNYLSYELENEAAFLKLQLLSLKDAGFDKLEKEIFSRTKEPRILDIGCATGALLDNLRNKGWHVTGVEISPCAEYAVHTRKLDVKNIPLEANNFPDCSFDVVLASHLIEHLNAPSAFLKETFRILKNNGYCFITTPNISGFQARLFASRWRSAIFDHLYLFSAASLSGLLRKTGFKIEKIRTWGGLGAGYAPLWLKKCVDVLAKKLGFGDVMIVRGRKI
ncbi:MAG: class I SAM-dependent methyltransferase [Treponema sp.]|nr:class I SAM-dependent methyltransferase [Treponema sp.]